MIPFTKDIAKVDFLEGSLLLVDKPLTWTSFDVVNKIRFTLKYKLGVKKLKVGHAGTLDPLATGLLLICTGKFTKKIESLQGLDKSYSGSFKLGATTPSYDAESEEDQIFEYQGISEKDLIGCSKSFIGLQKQFPPIYSAVKIKGMASYKLARKGESVEMKPRNIHIHDFQLINIELPVVDFFVSCSKGTYIRSLAHDFGKCLNNGAYLKSLRRLSIGGYTIEEAWELPELLKAINNV